MMNMKWRSYLGYAKLGRNDDLYDGLSDSSIDISTVNKHKANILSQILQIILWVVLLLQSAAIVWLLLARQASPKDCQCFDGKSTIHPHRILLQEKFNLIENRSKRAHPRSSHHLGRRYGAAKFRLMGFIYILILMRSDIQEQY
jgi:hypothetical protein